MNHISFKSGFLLIPAVIMLGSGCHLVPVTASPVIISKPGRAENFMKGNLADKQIVKLAIFGNSIFFSGFGPGVTDGTRGFATLEYDHLAKRIFDYLDYNKPVFRGIEHPDWTFCSKPGKKNAWYPYRSRYSGVYAVLDPADYAQISGVTGYGTIVFVFEGGIEGVTGYQTGKAEILVSADGGLTWDTPSNIGLSGEWIKYGFGDDKVFAAPLDEFNSAFDYPANAFDPLTGNKGTSPIREVVYQIDSLKEYFFRIRTKPGEKDPVHLWGCYYFTGQTFIPINVSLPGASWTTLRKVVYNSLVLTGVDYVICEAPMYHDFAPLDEIGNQLDGLVNEINKYGMEVSLTSCPPGGVITEPFVNALGDEEPVYFPGDNFVYQFNHRKAVWLNSVPAYADYPEYGTSYSVLVNGTEYTGSVGLRKPSEDDYPGWVYRKALVLIFDEAPEHPDLENDVYPLTFIKQSGIGSETLTAASVKYMPPDMDTHRELVMARCEVNDIKFIDVLAAYERIAESVGETIETGGYPMNSGHPRWHAIDRKARRVTLSTSVGMSMPDAGDVFSALIHDTIRYFEISSIDTVKDCIQLKSINGGGQDYIYPGDPAIVPSITSLYGIVYTKISGTGSLHSFTPVGIHEISEATMPIKMNYMSNFFSGSDGHHLVHNSIDVIFNIIRDTVLKDSYYK
jgi:hypothetical protein